MTSHAVVSEEQWIEARGVLLAEEKTLTRERDRVAKKRRELPWVQVKKITAFMAPQGP